MASAATVAATAMDRSKKKTSCEMEAEDVGAETGGSCTHTEKVRVRWLIGRKPERGSRESVSECGRERRRKGWSRGSEHEWERERATSRGNKGEEVSERVWRE
eukprot:4152860-Pleurochrysis_carterae.AAC.1